MNKIFILIFSISLIAIACNKEATIIEDNIESLDFQEIDTFTLKSKTVVDDAIDGKKRSKVLLGKTNDSRFGESKASFYTQFSLSKNDFSIGANPVLDSIVLILDQVGSYGKLENLYNINIYELSSDLDIEAEYNNNTVLNVKGTTLASLNNFKFTTGKTSLHLPLSNEFGNQLLSAFGTVSMESTDDFKTFMKGIYITATSTAGDGLVTFKTNTENTKLELFYHSDSETAASFVYNIGTKDVTINQYVNNNNTSDAKVAADNNNKEISFISGMSGFKTLVEFPDLTALKNIIVNKAELIVYQEDYGSDSHNNFPEIEIMYLYQKVTDTEIAYLDGYSKSEFGPLSIKSVEEINGNNTNVYAFQITKYIQNLILNQTQSNEIFLIDLINDEGNRLKIGGSDHAEIPMKLNIVYTKIK